MFFYFRHNTATWKVSTTHIRHFLWCLLIYVHFANVINITVWLLKNNNQKKEFSCNCILFPECSTSQPQPS